jgi:hypothetical protein
MSGKKRRSKSKTHRRAGLQSGVVGLSLSLAGAACAESTTADAATQAQSAHVQALDLREEEVFDVSMASFYLVDKENPGGLPAVARIAANDTTHHSTSVVGQQGAGRRGSSPTTPSGGAPVRGCRGCRACRACQK